MITMYQTGSALLAENRPLLDTQPDLSAFFRLDAPLLTHTDTVNYALRCECSGETLLVLKVEPYNLLLFGSEKCVPELLAFLFDNGHEIKNYLCEAALGAAVQTCMRTRYAVSYNEALSMDFMEANTFTEPSAPEVMAATESDVDEILECLTHFITDCGLLDSPGDRTQLQKQVTSFRVIKTDGRIVSMAQLARETAKDCCIVAVYTRNEYRGKGYARKVVNTVKNEILASGRRATLNVDRRNPVSCHLYTSLGFRRVFSQSEFRRID